VRRLRLIAPAAGTLLLAALLLRAAGPTPASPPAPSVPPAAAAAEPDLSAYVPVRPPARDVFRYADEPEAPRIVVAPSPVRPVEPPPPLAPPPPEPVRLVGFVHRSGGLQAVLAIHGEVVVLSVGESSGGYVLLELDEDAGATVRDSGGEPLHLPPPGP
jgi:hypothetical protein